MIAVYASWGFARIDGIGWGWAGVIWLYSIVFYIPLDVFKFIIRYALSGKGWNNLLQNKVFLFTERTFMVGSYERNFQHDVDRSHCFL